MTRTDDTPDGFGSANDSDLLVSEEDLDSNVVNLAGAVAAVPGPVDVDHALDGDVPLLMLHRGQNWFTRLPRLLNEMHAAHHGSLNQAVVVRLRRDRPARTIAFLDRCASASVKIVDPEGYLLWERTPGVDVPRRRYPADHPWLTLPAAPNQAWVRSVVAAQRDVGANLLLSPGLWMPGVHRRAELDSAIEQARWTARSLRAGERLAVNMTLDTTWLTSTTHRDDLMHEISESSEQVFYLRFRWPIIRQPYGQPADVGILDGYREIAEHAYDLGKTLLLPNTDLTGWVALGWGAHGFGTGLMPGDRSFAAKADIRIPADKRRPAKPRYFERGLLHTVDGATHDLLAGLRGYVACPCRYCVSQRALAPNWDRELAAQHHITKLGELVATVSAAPRGPAAKQEVNDANSYRDRVSASINLGLDGTPRHLPLWAARLP